MKKIQIAALSLVVLTTAAAGWWLAARPTAHRHALVKMKTAEGKTYYSCAMHAQVRLDGPGQCPICGMTLVRRSMPAAAATQPAVTPEKALYWYDPMKPEVHFDAPGKSPFMDMQLVPKFAATSPASASAMGEQNSVQIDPRMVQNLGVRTRKVESGIQQQSLETVGLVMANERSYQTVEARVPGWIERLAVRAVNDPVQKGQLLAEIYSPELLAAQEEFLLAERLGDADLLAAARQRLGLLGLTPAQISRLQQSHKSSRRIALYAESSGYVSEIGVREGAQVSPGMALFRIANLDTVWVSTEIPEAQAAYAVEGRRLELRLAAFPGKGFVGKIDFVYPELDAQSRTLKARAVLANPGHRLRPGMYASLRLQGAAQPAKVLLVDSAALIRRGSQSLVLVAEGGGRFTPTPVETGAESQGRTEIRSGLVAGQEVVVSGQFLIDSEANLSGVLDRLAGASDAAGKGIQP